MRDGSPNEELTSVMSSTTTVNVCGRKWAWPPEGTRPKGTSFGGEKRRRAGGWRSIGLVCGARGVAGARWRLEKEAGWRAEWRADTKGSRL